MKSRVCCCERSKAQGSGHWWMAGVMPVLACLVLSGCVPLRQYHHDRVDYVRVVQDEATGVEADLCIIEFDDEGEFWDIRQLAAALATIRDRNQLVPGGVVVPVFIHGWKNNADWRREEGDLRRIARELTHSAVHLAETTPDAPPRVVGVYIGWRGDTTKMWLLREMTFWNRLLAADRVASLHLKETLSKIMLTTKQRPESKVIMYGHSMGGRILFHAMAESLISMSVNEAGSKAILPVDLVIMANPAIRAVDVARFIDLLKRHDVKLVVTGADGTPVPAEGPLIAAITSEADGATKRAFPFGQRFVGLFRTYRKDAVDGHPSQGYLAAHTDGHTDRLLSHRADVRDGRVVVTPVPDRYNDTPYWVIRVSPEICRDHGDINNPRLNELVEQLLDLREAYTATNWPRLVTGRFSGLPGYDQPVKKSEDTEPVRATESRE